MSINDILIIFLILAFGFLILSFFISSIAESIVIKITDWCIRKIDTYRTKGIKKISLKGFIYTICFLIVKIFKHIDKIENERLRTWAKLNVASFIVSISIAILSFSLIIFLYLIGFYIAFKIIMFILWLIAGRPTGKDYGSELNDIYNTLKGLVKGLLDRR